MYSVDLTNRYVEAMGFYRFSEIFPQSKVLKRSANLCVCV